MEAQEKDVKIDFMSIIEVLKEEINESLLKIQENPNKEWEKMRKTFQHLKLEIDTEKQN